MSVVPAELSFLEASGASVTPTNAADLDYWRARTDIGTPDACWPWTGYITYRGYGYAKSRNGAHRFTWELFFGTIPDGELVLHHCDNPPCCNPSHLWLGTQKDNMRDAQEKGRKRTVHDLHYCPQGHLVDGENAYWFRGYRQCKECRRSHSRAHQERRRRGH